LRLNIAAAIDRVMEFQDKLLKCVDCGKDFIFTAGEQLFFHDKQFHNDPKRCKACKLKRGGGSSVRAETRTHCSVCGQETTVPFRPTQGRPVLCRSCFEQNRRTPSQTQPVVGSAPEGEPVVAAMGHPTSAGSPAAPEAEAKSAR
jgi:CxxC-x17-CxxC domain-containing protein